ncbi:Na+/H+ antiporter NhaD/arsenite permease-like protein [Bradyrhizobium sp. LB9.1b]
MFYLGLGVLIAVPVFKTVTHLPPFMGVLLGLGIVWLVGEILHRNKDEHVRGPLTLAHALTRIDMGSIVFFLGILLAVASLEHAGLLSMLAKWLDAAIGRQDLIVIALGLLSAVIDNVPLVAATMGMYDLGHYPPDSFLWEFIAYCAGTGGSILIIGSAAGVARHGARAHRVPLVCPPHRRPRARRVSGGSRGVHRAACGAAMSYSGRIQN